MCAQRRYTSGCPSLLAARRRSSTPSPSPRGADCSLLLFVLVCSLTVTNPILSSWSHSQFLSVRNIQESLGSARISQHCQL